MPIVRGGRTPAGAPSSNGAPGRIAHVDPLRRAAGQPPSAERRRIRRFAGGLRATDRVDRERRREDAADRQCGSRAARRGVRVEPPDGDGLPARDDRPREGRTLGQSRADGGRAARRARRAPRREKRNNVVCDFQLDVLHQWEFGEMLAAGAEDSRAPTTVAGRTPQPGPRARNRHHTGSHDDARHHGRLRVPRRANRPLHATPGAGRRDRRAPQRNPARRAEHRPADAGARIRAREAVRPRWEQWRAKRGVLPEHDFSRGPLPMAAGLVTDAARALVNGRR